MNLIREDLGEDAIIVSTTEDAGNVHMTAAIETDRIPGASADMAATSNDDWIYEEDGEASLIDDLTDVMLRHAAPEEVLDQLISCAMVVGQQDPRAAMQGALEMLFRFKPLPQHKTSQPTLLVGPPGAGKTLAAAKLAARAAMNGQRVSVITTDTVRAGGVEQLEAFTRLMDVPLQKASSLNELKARIAESAQADQIIIDTAGTNPFDQDAVKIIAKVIGAADMMPVMVLPAGIDAEESGEIAKIFASVGVKQFLSTRLDVARRLGGLLAAAYMGGMSFAEISRTAKVADGLVPLSTGRLTQLLMPRAEEVRMTTMKKAG